MRITKWERQKGTFSWMELVKVPPCVWIAFVWNFIRAMNFMCWQRVLLPLCKAEAGFGALQISFWYGAKISKTATHTPTTHTIKIQKIGASSSCLMLLGRRAWRQSGCYLGTYTLFPYFPTFLGILTLTLHPFPCCPVFYLFKLQCSFRVTFP